MSDPEQMRDSGAEQAEVDELDEEPRNPFDNPYFLPLLLAGFSLWCGWDGFVSSKFADRPGTLWFNRVLFLVLGALAAWLTRRARSESADRVDPS